MIVLRVDFPTEGNKNVHHQLIQYILVGHDKYVIDKHNKHVFREHDKHALLENDKHVLKRQ